MPGKVNNIINLIGNMGWRYVLFRAGHELFRRSGLLRKKYPIAPPHKQYVSLEQFRKSTSKFFFDDRESVVLPRNPNPSVKERFEQLRSGKFLLFNSMPADLGQDYDWVTNPDSGYRYDVHKHWTQIADYSKEAGDIKYVWEKSRFSYLYDIIRYDYHFREDCGPLVFNDILSWIRSNPINCGPNYRCSQEMSLRVLNWTFALYYYRNSTALTTEIFDQIQNAIYWHMDHVYKNIDFSRIAVRNNHAITETLALYLVGLFFPSFPNAAAWKAKGKRWFEEEIAYQIYGDGTYLQFSMNYHRIVVQLMTWGIVLAEKNGERFSDVVYDRARKSVMFLRTCMVEENGWLPNYGANDGALFFKLSNTHYRDYRPQLQALAYALGMDAGIEEQFEDVGWYGVQRNAKDAWKPADGIHSFAEGGYYIIREPETLTFIKCGSYKDRPSQADNLHLDIWYKGENILPDAGSYKYNTDDETIRYFSGTASHNTVMLDNADQMLKGGRFIWYYWTQRKEAALAERDGSYVFTGGIYAFKHIKGGIVHERTIVKHKGQPVWEITDVVAGVPDAMSMRQLWHTLPQFQNKVSIEAKDDKGSVLMQQMHDGWYSSLYGQKEKTKEYYFSTQDRTIRTIIKVVADS